MNAANVIALGATTRWLNRSTDVARKRMPFVPAAPVADTRVLDLTHDAVSLRGTNGAIQYWNRAAEALYGWTADEAAGRVCHELLETLFPAPIEQIEAQVLRTAGWEGELIHTRKDGSQVTVASRWSLQRAPGAAAIVVYEVPVVQASAVSATVAHEIRQPLTAMVASADAGLRYLDRPMPNLEKAMQAFKRIAADGHRAGAVVECIRTNLRTGANETTALDVNQLVREAICLKRGDLHRNRITVHAESGKQRLAKGNRIQLQQVLLNLIANAIDAMSANEGPRILRVGTEAREGGEVAITVADNGPGVESGNVERIFNPLFTTKTHGMGMGLAICRAIVEGHGGRLTYAANAPRGAVFQLTLSCA